MKNQSEEMRDLQSAKKQPPRRTGQKRPKKQPEKATFRGKGTPEKELGKHLKAKVKAIKGRICRERSNNAMLKRTEKRKQ